RSSARSKTCQMRSGAWKDAAAWHESGMKRIADYGYRSHFCNALHALLPAGTGIGQKLMIFADKPEGVGEIRWQRDCSIKTWNLRGSLLPHGSLPRPIERYRNSSIGLFALANGWQFYRVS